MNTAHETGWYEIRIQGHLDERWADWFDGMTVTQEPGGVTMLRGSVVDQAALHGLLARLRDLGLPLISVVSTEAGVHHVTGPGPGAGPDSGRSDR